MNKQEIPAFCRTCIKRFQHACLHKHTTMLGGFHFTAGEVWDDLQCVCLDCGADLDRLPVQELDDSNFEVPFRRSICKI